MICSNACYLLHYYPYSVRGNAGWGGGVHGRRAPSPPLDQGSIRLAAELGLESCSPPPPCHHPRRPPPRQPDRHSAAPTSQPDAPHPQPASALAAVISLPYLPGSATPCSSTTSVTAYHCQSCKFRHPNSSPIPPSKPYTSPFGDVSPRGAPCLTRQRVCLPLTHYATFQNLLADFSFQRAHGFPLLLRTAEDNASSGDRSHTQL